MEIVPQTPSEVPDHLKCKVGDAFKQHFSEADFRCEQEFYRRIPLTPQLLESLEKGDDDDAGVLGLEIKFPQVSVNWSALCQPEDIWAEHFKKTYKHPQVVSRFGCCVPSIALEKAKEGHGSEWVELAIKLCHDPCDGTKEDEPENYAHCLICLFKGETEYIDKRGGFPRPLRKVFRQEAGKLMEVKGEKSLEWSKSLKKVAATAH